MPPMPTRRPWAGWCVALTALTTLAALTACSGDAGDPASAVSSEPANLDGLVLVDCWNDTAGPLDPANAALGPRSALTAPLTDKKVTVASLCTDTTERYGSGITAFDRDFRRVAASRATDDGTRVVGYVDVGTGTFTDLSKRLQLDANGNPTDAGTAVDEFVGPITDDLIGFAPDDSYYLERADRVFSAAPPAYDTMQPHPADALVGTRFTGQGPAATSSFSDAPLLEVPADTPGVTADDPWAPLVFATQDQQLRCDAVRWIDASHLLCRYGSEAPSVIATAGAVLTPTSSYADAFACFPCDGRPYVWVLPDDATHPLVPKTQRALVAFTVGDDGLVYFLATAGKQYFLYSVDATSAVPKKRGAITLPEGSAPDKAYLALQWR